MHPAARLTLTLVLTAGLAVTAAWWAAKPKDEASDAGSVLSKRALRSAGTTVQASTAESNSEQGLSSRLRQLAMDKPAAWQAEMARLLAGLDLAEFPGLLEAIAAAAYPRETERLLLDELFAVWGKRDPQAAVTVATGAGRADDVLAVLKGWSAVADEDAWRWVDENVANSGGLLGRIKPDYYGAILAALVAEGRVETALILADTKVPLIRTNLISQFAGFLTDKDPVAASAFLKTIKPAEGEAGMLDVGLMSRAAGQVGMRLSVRGVDELIARLGEHSEATQKLLIEGALTGWVVRKEFDSMERFLAEAPEIPESTYDSMLATLGAAYAQKDAKEALRTLNMVKNVAARDVALEMAAMMAMVSKNPPGAIELAGAVTAEGRRNRRLVAILNEWIANDRSAAGEFLSGGVISESVRTQLKGL